MIEFEFDTVVALKTNAIGERSVRFLGYGFTDHEHCQFVFWRYADFEAPLEDVLDEGFGNYEECNCSTKSGEDERFSEYEDMVDVYLSIDNGKPPVLIREGKIDMNTPDGVYLLC